MSTIHRPRCEHRVLRKQSGLPLEPFSSAGLTVRKLSQGSLAQHKTSHFSGRRQRGSRFTPRPPAGTWTLAEGPISSRVAAGLKPLPRRFTGRLMSIGGDRSRTIQEPPKGSRAIRAAGSNRPSGNQIPCRAQRARVSSAIGELWLHAGAPPCEGADLPAQTVMSTVRQVPWTADG